MLSPEKKQLVQNLVGAIDAFQDGISQQGLEEDDLKILEKVVKSLATARLTLESEFLRPALEPAQPSMERFASASKVLEGLAQKPSSR